MKKSALFLFAGLFTIIGFAQERTFIPPDYDRIKDSTSTKECRFYYPQLLERFQDLDTTLTREEFHYLYYGYTFQPEYSPYSMNKELDEIGEILKKDTLTLEDHREILSIAKENVSKSPFDMDSYYYMINGFENTRDTISYEKSLKLYLKVLDVIVNSGDGRILDNPFYVISTKHEYWLLEVFGFRSKGQALIGSCDKLKLVENESEIEAFYFDVSPCLNHLNKMFKD